MADLISRQTAIDALESRRDDIKPNGYEYDYDMGRRAGLDTAVDIIEALPPAEQRTGHWDKDGKCDQCGEESGFSAYGFRAFSPYCPHCGARMIGDEEDGHETD